MKRYLTHLATSFRSHAGLIFATLLVLTASFFVTGALLVTGQNLTKVLTLWGDSLQMSVYLKDDAGWEQVQALQQKLKNDSRIEKSEHVSRAQALATFQEQMATYAPDLMNDAHLMKFIPESLQIQISKALPSERQLDTLKALAADLGVDNVVDSVSYGQDWVQTYASIVGTVSKAGFWIVVLIMAASAFVISNSISSSIHQRKNEIEVLELVGAPRSMIRGPFLFEGFILGFIAGLLAIVALAAAFQMIESFLRTQGAFLQLAPHLQFFGLSQMILFVVGAGCVGLISSYLSLRKLNSGWAASRSGQEA